MTAKLKVISSEASSFTLNLSNSQCCARPIRNIAGTTIAADHHGAR
jgi:hypothetical protein